MKKKKQLKLGKEVCAFALDMLPEIK